MEKIFSAIPFYYGSTRDAPNTVRISVEMAEETQASILRRAVAASMPRYPYFCVKVVLAGSELELDRNREEVAVLESGAPVPLGGEEANGHLLAFSCQGNYIFLDFFHGLADGGSIFPLLRTVLYYYCRERYDASLSPKGIRLPGEEIPLEEIQEPYPQAVDAGIQPRGRAKRKPALDLAKAGLCTLGKPMRHRIRIPEQEFMRYSRNQEGSPASVLALFLARTIDGLHPGSELPIICGMAMNIRNVLGKPLSHHSLVSQLFLEYKDSIRHMDIRQQVTCFRGMVMVQSQEENILVSVRNNIRLFGRMAQCPDIQAKRTMMQQAVSANLGVDTFKVSYVGKSGLGAAEPYVKSIYSDIDLNGSGIMMEVNATNGWFTVSFLQEWPEDVYVKAFLEQLESQGIAYGYEGVKPLEVSSVAIG